MEHLHLYNTIARKKEKFEPLNPPFVGMYVCGPTVYSESHLGHARPAVVFDVLNRYMRHMDYDVRFVRNVTDVGHLENDEDDTGEDKMLKKARAMKMEPMQVAQYYLNMYHDDMDALNCLRPDIEPLASGHIPEQIEHVETLIKNGYAYEAQGNVYFDTERYDADFGYGKLSNRKMEDLRDNTRDELVGGDTKKRQTDFALWKKADPNHIMRWKSPWSEGYPGWHLECTVMSTKYLGTKYDIHGGGMDLVFPHHEAEIAQSNGAINDPCSHQLDEAKYWVHNNMITIDGVKMARRAGNFISLQQAFSGDHPRLSKAYSPIVVRFSILRSHYRSVTDFSDESLQASESGFQRISDAWHRLQALDPESFNAVEVNADHEKNLANFRAEAFGFINDDLNTPRAVARMYDAISVINEIDANKHKPFPVEKATWAAFKTAFNDLFTEVLGLVPVEAADAGDGHTEDLMQVLIRLRAAARKDKNWGMADMIRDELGSLNIKLKDTPLGTEWYVEN
ncbi:MAG: cysteine--tRNA ligase [Bacteroidota bacterium]